MSTGFLFQALVFMGASIVLVPIAKKIGLSSVLGYLVAGILIGPFVLGFVGENGQDIMHASEFGVVMMLFLIGLELNPRKFWEMRKAILGLGGLQVAGTTALLFISFLLMKWQWEMALAVALAFSMSSTAIVLQTLKEKNISRTIAGEASFSVLLFQDIAVIPILALLPLLGTPHAGAETHSSLFSEQPAWIQAISVFVVVGLILLIGKFLVVPFLRFVSKSQMRELFVAAALFIVVGVAALMQAVGLSPALGTFLAGMVLANTEFRHELESDIEPFKGLLLGLFFVSVGATIDFDQIMGDPATIALLVVLVLVFKFIVLIITGKLFKMSSDQNLIFSFGLSQVGEFAFVLLSFSNQINLLDAVWNAKLMAVVAITMASTPLVLLLNEKLIEPYFGVKTKSDEQEESDTIDTQHKVIIAGFGHFGSTVGRFLRANGIKATILDNDSDRVDLLRRMGFEVYFGDATRVDLLEAAGASEAAILIAAIDPPELNHLLVETAKKKYPNLRIFARARNRYDAYDLMDMHVEHIYRETLDTAVRLGVDAMVRLGFRKYTATRQAQKFIHYDEQSLEKLSKNRHNVKEYALSVREQVQWQEQILQNDLFLAKEETDISWDSEHLRQVVTQNDPKK